MYPGSKKPRPEFKRSYPTLTLPHDRILCQVPACCQLVPIPPFSSLTIRCNALARHPLPSFLPDKPCEDTLPSATTHMFTHLLCLRPYGPMLVDSTAAMRHRPMGGEGHAHNHTGLGTWIYLYVWQWTTIVLSPIIDTFGKGSRLTASAT
jgi:hypothetical protein